MVDTDEDIGLGINVEVTGTKDIEKLSSSLDKLDLGSDGVKKLIGFLNKLNGVKISVGSQINHLANGLKKLNGYRMDERGIDSAISAVKRLDDELSQASVKVGSSVDGLARGLSRINLYSRNDDSFDSVIESVKRLDKELSGKSVSIGDDVNKLANSLRKLNALKLGGNDAFADEGASTSRLAHKLANKSIDIGPDVNKLANSLNKLKGVNLGGPDAFANEYKSLGTLSEKLEDTSISVSRDVNRLAGGLKKLNEYEPNNAALDAVKQSVTSLSDGLSGSSIKVGSEINRLMNSLRKLNEYRPDEGAVDGVINTVKRLADSLQDKTIKVGSDVNRLVNSLNKLSTVKTTGGVANGTDEAVASVNKLAASTSRIDVSGMRRLAKGAGDAASGTRRVASALDEASGSSVTFAQRMGDVYNALHKIASVYFVVSTLGHMFRDVAAAIMTPLNAAADFQEQMNLMTVSLGQYAEEAYNYAQKVHEALGIDVGEYLSNQGTFMTLAKGFGVASDAANVMSGNLTRLSYDLASFFNMTNEEAFEKVRSAMSGETEAIKQLGFDLSQARLQQIAYDNGITQSVSEMTQADKAYLRYIAIMEQVSWAHGDLARTIASPANQMRILQSQAKTAAVAIGNVLMPMLAKIIPVAVAVVKVIATLANKLAEVFGGKGVYHVDFGQGGELSNLGGAGDDAARGLGNAGNAAKGAGDKAGNAAGKVKELKRELMGFDEINKFSTKTDSSGSAPSGGSGGSGGGGNGGAGGGGSAISGIDLPTDEWEFDDSFADEWVKKIEAFLDRLWAVIEPTVDVIAGYLDQIKKQFDEADVLGAFENAFVGAVDFLSTIVRDMARVLGPVLVAFNIPATLESAFNFIGQLFTTLADILDEVGIVLGKFSETFVAPIAEIAGKSIRGALDGMTAAMKSFSDWINSHADVCRTAIAGIIGAFAGFKTAKFVVTAINRIITALDTFQFAADMMRMTNNDLALSLSGAADVFPWFAGLIEKIPPSLGVFANSFAKAKPEVGALDAAMCGLETVLGSSVSVIFPVVAAIAAVAAAIAWWATQTEDGRKVWEAFCDSVASIVQNTKATVVQALQNVGKALGDTGAAVGRLVGVVGELALGALSVAIRVIATVIALIATGLAKVLEFLAPIVNFIASLALNVIATVLEGIATVLGWIADGLGTVVDGIGGFIAGLFGIETAEASTSDAIENTTDAVDGQGDALSEHEQKVQDNIQAINDYDDANGTLQRTLQNTGMSVEDLAGYLADTDQTVDEFVRSIEDYADSIINGFDRIDTSSQISLDDMVGNLTSNIQTTEAWSSNLEKLMADTGLSANDALVQEMIAGGPAKYSKALEEIVSSSDNEQKFVDAANRYGDTLTKQFGSAVNGGLPEAQKAGENLTAGVGTGMDSGAAQTAQTAASVDQQTVEQFGSHYNEAKDAGRNLAGGFGDGVREASNDATVPATEVMGAVVAALNGGNGYQQALSAGMNLVGGYGDGISAATYSAVSLAQSAMSQVVAGLNGGAGYSSANSAGQNLMGGYKDGLQAAVAAAVSVAKSAMTQVNAALGSGNSTARSKGSQMMQQFVSGLRSGVGNAQSVGRNAAVSVQSGLGSNYNGAYSAGSNEMYGFINGLSAAMGNQAWWKGRDAAVSAQNGLGSNYWGAYSAGSNLMYGFNNGMCDVQHTVYNTARAIASNAASIMRRALRIRSPSRVTAEIGRFFTLGAAVGMDDEAETVYSSVRDLSSGMVEALDVADEAARVGESIGRGFSDALDGSISQKALSPAVEYGKAVASQARDFSYTNVPSRLPHEGSWETTDDAYMTSKLASAFAQGLVSVQMAQGSSTAGKDTTIVLRVGNEDLARAVVKGQDSLARRGVVKLG